MRNLFLIAAVCGLAGCVTPMSADQQTPKLNYMLAAPEAVSPASAELVSEEDATSTLAVSVIDERVRTEQGRSEELIGFFRNYGIPVHWTVTKLGVTDLPSGSTMADYMSARIVSALESANIDAVSVDPEVIGETDTAIMFESSDASKMVTFLLNEWHVDINMNWVGAFRFDHDTDVMVRDAQGVILEKNFAESESVDAQGNNSWNNMVLAAFREQMQEILEDEEVKTALLAPARSEPPAPVMEAAIEESPETPAVEAPAEMMVEDDLALADS